jgi:hypothetical protein
MNSEGSGLGFQIHGGLTSQWFESTFCAFVFFLPFDLVVVIMVPILGGEYHIRGCSSNGRAPALHAGGTGIDTLLLHIFL